MTTSTGTPLEFKDIIYVLKTPFIPLPGYREVRDNIAVSKQRLFGAHEIRLKTQICILTHDQSILVVQSKGPY